MASICKRKEGWQVQIRKKGYKPVSKSFQKKSEADAWARQIESEMDRSIFVDRTQAEQTTLGELLDRYLAQITPHKKGFKQETSRIGVIRDGHLSSRALSTLTSADFASYRDSRLKSVSGTTVNKELNLFAHAFDVAKKDWAIPVENPVRSIRRPKNNPSRERRLKVGEETKLTAAAGGSILAEIIPFALETAMRRGEIAEMRWEHVNLNDSILLIPETKTGFSRTVPLSPKACQVLRKLPRRLDGGVFGVEPQSITQAFERACERAEIDDLRFHDLRHEATSRLFERNLNPMQVSAITGHRTLEMLKRYTHLKPQDLVKLLR